MVEIRVEGDRAVFEVQGWDKLWSLRSRLEIPLAHIRGARWEPTPPMGWFQGVKLAGADVPNLFRAGTFIQQGGLVFWDVLHPERAVAVDLEHERYHQLVVEVGDPAAAVALLTAAAGGRRA
jgi:hypothetical protein